jgi:SAM-dependent methyltransferase
MSTPDVEIKKRGITQSVRNLWRRSFSQAVVAGTEKHLMLTRLDSNATQAAPKEARFLRDDEHQNEKIGDREYISGTTYFLNTDEDDVKRLDQLQEVITDMFGGLYTAPLKKDKIHGVLEVGYGSGAWAIDMAKAFPQARVFAFDIRTNPISMDRVPSNLIFQRCDLSKGLPYMSKSFDFINQRMVGLAAKPDQWPGIFDEFYRVLRPGGWIEMKEVNAECKNSGPITERMFGLLKSMATVRGMDMSLLGTFDVLLKNAGFTKVTKSNKVHQLMGSWAGKNGIGMLNQAKFVVSTMEPLAVQVGLCQPGEIQPLIDQWEEECNRLKTYQLIHTYTAKKPV